MTAPWLQTLGGGALDLCDPEPEQINLRHAAKVLARIPRFGGHTRDGVLSVAQHSVEGGRAIMRETGREDAAAAFLLHDFHEAYIGDIATPVAEALQYAAHQMMWPQSAIREAIAHLKWTLDCAIYARAGIAFPLSDDVCAIVKDFDKRMCVTEHAARMDPLPRPYPYISETLAIPGCDLTPWPAELAESLLIGAMQEFEINVERV